MPIADYFTIFCWRYIKNKKCTRNKSDCHHWCFYFITTAILRTVTTGRLAGPLQKWIYGKLFAQF
jgi:hypothetical protein